MAMTMATRARTAALALSGGAKAKAMAMAMARAHTSSSPLSNGTPQSNNNDNAPASFDMMNRYWASATSAVNMAAHAAVPANYPEQLHQAMRHALLWRAPTFPCHVLCFAAADAASAAASAAAVTPTATAVHMLATALTAGADADADADGDAAPALAALAVEQICAASEESAIPVAAALRMVRLMAAAGGSQGVLAGRFFLGRLRGAGAGAALDERAMEYAASQGWGALGELSAECGALAAGAAGGDVVGALRRCGKYLGMAFAVKELAPALALALGRADVVASSANSGAVVGPARAEEMVQQLCARARDAVSELRPGPGPGSTALTALADHVASPPAV